MLQPHERRLVLASSSPRRKQLMGLLGLPYDVVVKPVDEQIAPGVIPEEAVRELALRKARAAVKDVREIEIRTLS